MNHFLSSLLCVSRAFFAPVLAAVVLLLAPCASAQVSIPELTVENDSLALFDKTIRAAPRTFPNEGPFELAVQCKESVDCADVDARLLGLEKVTSAGSTGESQRSVIFLFEQDAWPESEREKLPVIELKSNGISGTVMLGGLMKAAATTRVGGQNPSAFAPETGMTNNDENLATGTLTVTRALSTDCSPELRSAILQASQALPSGYSERRNKALFVISASGTVVSRPGAVIDEDDAVEVVVVGHPAVIPRMFVRRTSDFRTPGIFSVVGAGGSVPGGTFVRMSAAGDRVECKTSTTILSDFSPGQATVEIGVLSSEGEVTTGSFDFGVSSLYMGALGIGAFHSNLEDHEFDLATVGDTTVIVQSAGEGPRLLYAITYTPFVWGQRNLDRERSGISNALGGGGLIGRINPTVGLALTDVSENAFMAASVDLASAVYIHAGYHFGRVRRLNADAGVALGQAYGGLASSIPTKRVWAGSFAWGITVDLRVGAALIRTALTGAPGS